MNVVNETHKLYSSLNFSPPQLQFTVLASFALTSEPKTKLISLATGSKCLPMSKLPPAGNALHDSHAEVLARRGAIRWFLEEIERFQTNGAVSDWIILVESSGKYALKPGVGVQLYVSTIPCGDASTQILATAQDQAMAALKDKSPKLTVASNGVARGRDGYSLYGILRTKPGRADSPPTLSMSCSDKIASWNVYGFQGALASHFLEPIYVSNIIIGEVEESQSKAARVDCERAFWKRLSQIGGLPAPGYRLNVPTLEFTPQPFVHSRTSLGLDTSIPAASCNECLSWVADSPNPREILIGGYKRGVSPAYRNREKFWPRLSKVSLFRLYRQILSVSGTPTESLSTKTYFDAKGFQTHYQLVKLALRGNGAPFSGWVRSGERWENFDLGGTATNKWTAME